jgi:hypothetical protein
MRSPGPEWSPRLLVSILIRSLHRLATSSCAVTAALAGCSVTRPSSHPPRPGRAATADLALARDPALAGVRRFAAQDRDLLS